MAFSGVLTFPNKFTPAFQPAEFDGVISTYLNPSTGDFSPYSRYGFLGTNYGVQETAPNSYVTFLAIPKGELELQALWASLSEYGEKRFTTPNGSYLAFQRYSTYIRVYAYYNGSSVEVAAFNVGSVLGRKYYICIFIDIVREYAVATFLEDRGGDSRTGQADWFDNGVNAQQFSNGKATLFYKVVSDIIIPPDPYENHNNNYSSSIGGGGGYDETSDTIAEGSLPTIGGNTSGMCTAYVPSLTQINALANRLADPTVYQVLGNTILKMDDIIIGLSIFPFAVPKITATHQLRINLVGVYVPSGLYIDKADGQYHEIPCGSLNVEEYWGNCLDYNPYTKVSIYLPFCGFYELDTDDVMGKTLTVNYRVDIMTGTCLASIIVDGSVMYQYAGQCSSQIPISSVSFDSFMQSIISVGVATATGGAGLAAAGASAALGDARANMAGMAHADVSQYQHESVRANFHKTVVDTQSSIQSATAGAIMSAKGQYKHAGAMTGIAGFMGAKKPYLIIKRPNQCIPSDYGMYHGYPSNTKAKLGDLYGYTVVDDIRLNIPDATVEEIIECEKLLKGGIII